MRMVPLMLLVAVGCLAGCGERPKATGTPAAAPTSPTSPNSQPTAAASSATVRFDPATLELCDPPRDQVATIHWDAGNSTAAQVDIKIARDDGSEGLFATEEPTGSKATGPWMRPGSVVIVRDHATGGELGRGAPGAKSCGG